MACAKQDKTQARLKDVGGWLQIAGIEIDMNCSVRPRDLNHSSPLVFTYVII